MFDHPVTSVGPAWAGESLVDSSVVWRATSATVAAFVVVVAEVNCITVVDRPQGGRYGVWPSIQEA